MNGKLIKVKDNVFDGKHPNGVYEGSVVTGYYVDLPIVGFPFVIGHSLNRIRTTSNVTEVMHQDVEKIIFKTLNSTYILEFLDKQ